MGGVRGTLQIPTPGPYTYRDYKYRVTSTRDRYRFRLNIWHNTQGSWPVIFPFTATWNRQLRGLPGRSESFITTYPDGNDSMTPGQARTMIPPTSPGLSRCCPHKGVGTKGVPVSCFGLQLPAFSFPRSPLSTAFQILAAIDGRVFVDWYFCHVNGAGDGEYLLCDVDVEPTEQIVSWARCCVDTRFRGQKESSAHVFSCD